MFIDIGSDKATRSSNGEVAEYISINRMGGMRKNVRG